MSHSPSELAHDIDDLYQESRVFQPPTWFVETARVKDDSLHREADADAEAYWARRAAELDWFTPFTKILDWTPPTVRWFDGGKLNLSHNCLDRHLTTDHANKAAIIWEGEPYNGARGGPAELRTLTYRQLHREVCHAAEALRALGVGKGDRVAIYLPMIPEAAIAMLACARIGAIHSVVFGGFSPEALADRINDAQAKVLITADGGYRRGRSLLLKHESDKALRKTPSIKHVLVVRRDPHHAFDCPMEPHRDVWWHDMLARAKGGAAAEPMDAEDPLFILYTSGTTGKPKGIVHTTGGYSVGTYATCRDVFDLRPSDVYWCTADVGWVTGHSYVVYGPLQNGATVLMYEGAPDFPERDRFWDICARHGVTVLYTAPTAIRAFMAWGDEHPKRHDLSSLRLLGSVGEPINPEAWMWYREVIGGGEVPVVDTWWQTETGAIMISGLPGVSDMKPGFCGRPVPGIEVDVVDVQGKRVERGAGYLVIRKPWPSQMRTIWGDHERYVATYFSKWTNDLYFPGDGAKRDADGRIMILGRVDDVLNVAGHRIGTMEVESALVDHPSVAEAAVIGRAHEIKGQAVVAFVSLREGAPRPHTLIDELKAHVVMKIGAIARPDDIYLTADLPKTRSGKIMRRLLRDVAEGRALGDTTTLADAAVVERLKTQYESSEG